MESSPTNFDKGNYTFNFTLVGNGLSVSGACPVFRVDQVPPVNVSSFVPSQPQLANRLSAVWSNYLEVGILINSEVRCNNGFDPLNALNVFNQDPLGAFTRATNANVTSVQCLESLVTRYVDYITNDLVALNLSPDWYATHFYPDGFYRYKSLRGSTTDFIPTLDAWLSTVDLAVHGGTANWEDIVAQVGVFTGLMHRMAMSGVVDDMVPRAATLMITALLAATKAPDNEYRALHSVALRPLLDWYHLTNDQRVPYVMSVFLRLMVEQDIDPVLLQITHWGEVTQDLNFVVGTALAALYHLTHDEAALNLSLALTESGILYAYDNSDKHLNMKLIWGYDGIKLIESPTELLLESAVEFKFAAPFINPVIVLPNQTFVVQSSIVIEGNFTTTSSSILVVSPGAVITVQGCAILSGKSRCMTFFFFVIANRFEKGLLIIDAKNATLDAETLLIQYSCREGEFTEVIIENGNLPSCARSTLQYTPTSVVLLVDSPSTCDPPLAGATVAKGALTDWQISLIVIGCAFACALVIGLAVGLTRGAKQRHEVSRIKLASRGMTTTM